MKMTTPTPTPRITSVLPIQWSYIFEARNSDQNSWKYPYFLTPSECQFSGLSRVATWRRHLFSGKALPTVFEPSNHFNATHTMILHIWSKELGPELMKVSLFPHTLRMPIFGIFEGRDLASPFVLWESTSYSFWPLESLQCYPYNDPTYLKQGIRTRTHESIPLSSTHSYDQFSCFQVAPN